MRGSNLDTPERVAAQLRALIAAASPSQRLARAVALSDLARAFALAGATGSVGASGPDAIRRRFLEQMYGEAVANWVDARTTARTPA